MTDNLPFLTLGQMAGAIRSKKISPVEVTNDALARARRLQPRLNCFITLLEDQAIDEAQRAEREICLGRYRGLLHGIPYTLKDVFATGGVRTTAGSRVLGNWVPEKDAAVVASLRGAGAVLLGKTNTSEFAAGPTTAKEHYGPARNPWDVDRVPGGSSGGSAAALAAGIGTFSLGTDTGGSIRMPAAACGVVGLKPSIGSAPRRGVVMLSWSLDTVGSWRTAWRTARECWTHWARGAASRPMLRHRPFVSVYRSSCSMSPVTPRSDGSSWRRLVAHVNEDLMRSGSRFHGHGTRSQ